MIITEEIKQTCEDSCGSKDPEKRHQYKTGFYSGYAIGVSEAQKEPKANPSKELYSIKPLKWRIEEDRITTGTIIGFYCIEEIEDGQFYLSFDRTGYSEVVKGVGQYKSISETKHQAQTHFESKLKQILNREI